MFPGKSIGRSLSFALLVLAIGATAQNQPQETKKKAGSAKKPVMGAPAPPALEQKALDILKASSDRLAAAHTLAFTALESYESPSRQGHPLVFVNKSEVTLQRPDKLRIITPGDGLASEFYYNASVYQPAGYGLQTRVSPKERREQNSQLR